MITSSDIASALAELGIGPADSVCLHSGLAGAVRLAGRGGQEKAETVIEGFSTAAPDGVLVVPTFTYSYTRDEAYEIASSPSTVGALGELYRTMPSVRRTADPIFSCAIGGSLPEPWASRLFEIGDTDCFGPESVFAYLREADAMLVFFGIGFDYCTFIYHVEQRLGVPYRYFKDFSGTTIDGERSSTTTVRYYVRELVPETENWFEPLWEGLAASGAGRELKLPRGPRVLAVRASAIEPEAERRLGENPDFLIRRGHAEAMAPAAETGVRSAAKETGLR